MLEHYQQIEDYDLFYADSTTVSEQGYVPYGWQFKDEEVAIPVCRGCKTHIFGIYSRQNEFHHWIESGSITAAKVISWLDEFSWKIQRPTVVVLDNAGPHRARKTMAMRKIWQQRGLYLFFLPPYSPQLNLIERLWKEIKGRWLKPTDYQSADSMLYAVWMICNAIGKQLNMNIANTP